MTGVQTCALPIYKNGLLSWLRGFQKAPNDIFLVHGEPEAKEDFAKTVKEELGYDPVVVKVFQSLNFPKIGS